MGGDKPNLKAKLEATANAILTLTPAKSHSLLGVVVAAAVIFVILGYWLLMAGKDTPGYIFFGFGIFLVLLVLLCWSFSHKNQDQDGAQPITLNDGPQGTSLTVDIRSLETLENTKQLLALCETVFHRRPLPNGQALLDENMQPIPNSSDAAAAAVALANAQAAEAASAVVKMGARSKAPELADAQGAELGKDLQPLPAAPASNEMAPSVPIPTPDQAAPPAMKRNP